MKAFLWVLRRPALSAALQLAILAPLFVSQNPDDVIGGYLVALPWLVWLVACLNLPLVGAAFRAFRVDQRVKRNHALEHATIHCLAAKSGRRFSGRAAPNGFRIRGRASRAEITAAFNLVRDAVTRGDPLPCVTPRCGSNLVTAYALSMTLLLFVAIWILAFAPPLATRAGALVFVVMTFALLRHPIGNAIQRRFFLAEDFTEVAARDVRKIPTRTFERGPVHFVETIVRRTQEPRGSSGPAGIRK